MAHAHSTSVRLRLVEQPIGDEARAAWPEEQRAKLEIIKENRIAAHAPALHSETASAIDPHDPRWVLAMQTQARLQGAILPPESRDQLLKNSKKLGLRPFEANLVIAIMQDRARQSKGTDVQPLLSLVHPPSHDEATKPQASIWPRVFLMIATAALMATLILRWLGS